MDDRGSGVLDDVRVLDLSGPIGAYCTHLLADLGADVALVEPPAGDRLRRVPPFADDDPRAALLFAYYHASKRSVVLDPDGDLLRRLGPGVDVVVVSPSPRTSLPGWDPVERSLAWAPHAIVSAITPFGLTGPHASWRATPMTSFAMGGNMVRIGPPEGPPVTAPGRQCWDEAGVHAAIAILAALAVVDDVGAQCIDISVHEVAAAKDFLIEQYDAVEMNVHGRSGRGGLPADGHVRVCGRPVRRRRPPALALGRVPRHARPARHARGPHVGRSARTARAERRVAGSDQGTRPRSLTGEARRARSGGGTSVRDVAPADGVRERPPTRRARATFVETPIPARHGADARTGLGLPLDAVDDQAPRLRAVGGGCRHGCMGSTRTQARRRRSARAGTLARYEGVELRRLRRREHDGLDPRPAGRGRRQARVAHAAGGAPITRVRVRSHGA